MSLMTLKDLYIEQLRDLYSAETQLLQALPKMAAAASNTSLKEAFNTHLNETRGQLERLERIFSSLSTNPRGHTCQAMVGLIKEGEEILQKPGDPDVKDAALIASAQRVEHYEIAGYGTVKTFAKHLEYDEHVQLLDQTLDEESNADKKLTKVAEGGWLATGINQEANR